MKFENVPFSSLPGILISEIWMHTPCLQIAIGSNFRSWRTKTTPHSLPGLVENIQNAPSCCSRLIFFIQSKRLIFSLSLVSKSWTLLYNSSNSKVWSFSSFPSMAESSEKDLMTTMTRRVASIANHLRPVHSPPNCISISLSNASMNDSYHRTHGEVSTHQVVWENVRDDSGEAFTDIVYEKAVGEAIAKVRLLRLVLIN